MDAKEYMERACLCGHKREVHMHGHTRQPNGELALACVPCGCCGCGSFIDEFERELGGNPMENEHLGKLARDLAADVYRAAPDTDPHVN